MSKSNSFENDFQKHVFQNAAIANIGNAGGLPAAGVAGSLYVRLYTSAVAVDDATIGTECAYSGYVAKGVAVVRSSAGWTVSNNSVSNAAAIVFGSATTSETVRYFAIWKDNTSSADSERLYWGQLTSDLAVSSGITPEFAIGALVINED